MEESGLSGLWSSGGPAWPAGKQNAFGHWPMAVPHRALCASGGHRGITPPPGKKVAVRHAALHKPRPSEGFANPAGQVSRLLFA